MEIIVRYERLNVDIESNLFMRWSFRANFSWRENSENSESWIRTELVDVYQAIVQ